ncbi:pilus assembly protein [Aeromicrobium sp. YIM 150415]|nr:pilus assembly protein [Aeromicrobium sp. YIM 150415]
MRRREGGSMSVEVVLAIPILVMLMLLVVAGGRYVSVKADIESAARDAARAASFERDAYAARTAAVAAAERADGNLSRCQLERFGGSFVAGGQVDITISCLVSNTGLGMIGLSGERRFTGQSSAPIDQYRRTG